MTRFGHYLLLTLLMATLVQAKPLTWGTQGAGDMAFNDGQEMSCYAPGIIRPDQGTIEMTVLMYKPSSELGNDWEALFRMVPAQNIGGNSLLTLMFPQLSYKEKGLWLVARSNETGRITYGKIHYPDITFGAGQTVKLAFSWGRELRVYVDGKRVGTTAFKHAIEPMPAVFHISRLSPSRTQAVKISSVQLEDAVVAANAQHALKSDENTTFLAVDELKTAQIFTTPWHKQAVYASVTPYWSPATQSFVLGDKVTYPLLTINQSPQDRTATVLLKALNSQGKLVLEQKYDLTLKAMQGYDKVSLPLSGVPSEVDHYDLHTTVTVGSSTREFDNSIVVIPAPQQGIRDGKMAQYLGYHYDFSYDAKPLKQMGVHWVRMWGVEPFLWFNAEPVKGQFQWDKADTVMKQARANDLQLLGLLGNTPRWAAVEPDEAHKAKHPLANAPARWKPRDINEWENYAGKVMDRYKDQVHYWEVCNEIDFHPPGLPASFSGSTAEYLDMVKSTFRQSRKVGHDTKVLLSGLSLGSVCDQNMPTDLIKMGVCDYIDAFNLHAYQVMHRVDELKNAVHAVKPGLPFWQTEQMWMHITNPEKRLWLTPAIYLWFMEEGFEKFFTFGFYDMYFDRSTLSPTKDHYVNAIFQNQVRACESYAGKLKFEGDAAFTVRHQLRRTDGKNLTVIGSEVGAFDLTVGAQSGTTAIDLMGHPIAIQQADSQMKLTVNDMAYIVSDQPLVLTNAQQRGAAVLMVNGDFEDITGDIDMSGLEVGKPTHWTMRSTTYDPKGKITLSKEARSGKFAMQVKSSGAGRVYLFEDVKIPAPGDYLFIAHLKRPDALTGGTAYLSYYDRDHNVIKVHLLPEVTTTYLPYRLLVHFDQAPPSPVALIIGLDKGAGALLIDDVDFKAVEPMRMLPQSSWLMPLKNSGNRKLSDNLVDGDRSVALSELARLAPLPTLGGVCFDLPAAADPCVLVASSDWPGTSTQVTDIPINRKLKKLAFAHTAMYVRASPGQTLGQYIVHYSDGSKVDIPLRMDRELRDWFVPAQTPDDKAPMPDFIFNTASGIELSAFTMIWDNPQPGKLIQSIDMVSSAPGILCLLGITGEN